MSAAKIEKNNHTTHHYHVRPEEETPEPMGISSFFVVIGCACGTARANDKCVVHTSFIHWMYGGGGDDYSWIDHRLQAGLTLAFLPWLSDFKSATSFGFLSPNYTYVACFFSFFFKKSKNELVRPNMVFLVILAFI